MRVVSDLLKYYGSTDWWKPRSRPMEIQIIEKGPNILKFKVIGEVHTLLNPLRIELSKDDDVAFVAYKIEHPLVDSAIFIVKTKEGDPLEAIKRAIERILNILKEAKEKFREAIEKGPQNPPFVDAITWKEFVEKHF